jgi:hypothetical protein
MTDPSPLTPALFRVMADPAIERKVLDGFQFPLGVYPTEAVTPAAAYTTQFEPADGSDASAFTGANFAEELEEWPDRYVFDILVSNERLRPLCRALFSFLPGRFFPILDILGHDAFREIDPYIAYELVGCERFFDALRFFDPFLFEDGLVGFGAMSIDPFFYVFVDEHKIITLRVPPELKEKMERLLAAFDLKPVEELASADSVSHEHRGVIVSPDDHPEMLTPDEVIERFRDNWFLQLNIDPATNLDADGNELGLTAWQCIARCTPEDDAQPESYAEVLLSAANLQDAEELAVEAVTPKSDKDSPWEEVDVIRADRVSPEQLAEWLPGGQKLALDKPGLHDLRWLTGGPAGKKRTT